MFRLENIFKHRNEQIKREAEFDQQLDKLKCKDILFSYYKFRRLVNRQQYHEFQKTPFWDKFSLAKEHLFQIDSLDEDLSSCIQYVQSCECIQNLLRDHNYRSSKRDLIP